MDTNSTIAKNTKRLVPQVQHYTWGRNSKDSLIADLLQRSETKPFAELWFGAHPKASSGVLELNKDLLSLIEEDPTYWLGVGVIKDHGPTLSFLLKILSIGAPLSIQAHPNRSLASILHQSDSGNYPDSNHKPEIGYALSEVTLLYGFRSKSEILDQFGPFSSIKALLPETYLDEVSFLRALSKNLFGGSKEMLGKLTTTYLREVQSLNKRSPEDDLVLQLSALYASHDPGILSPYLLNLITLQKGQTLYIGPNVPHAYLSGEIVECMASSDNVVRAGLTEKFIDTKTLLEMLDYAPHRLSDALIRPQLIAGGQRFQPPVTEFQLDELTVPGLYHEEIRSLQILFVLEGSATITERNAVSSQFSRGDSFVIPASAERYSLTIEKDSRIFRASVPL